MKKKIIALCCAVAVLATALVGVTLAYFTSRDNETNTFTVGNVSIDLIESQHHRANAGGSQGFLNSPGYEGNLVPADEYSQGHGWNNSYFPDAFIIADAETYKENYFNDLAEDIVPGRNIKKMPYIINTGLNAAYVRTRVLIPVSLFAIIDNGPSMWTTTAMNVGDVVSNAVNYYKTPEGYAAFMAGNAPYIVYRDNIAYYEFDFTYTAALQPGEMTFWNCWGNIRLDPNATSEQLANVESFNVIVEADAIQAEGFANYAAAFQAFANQNNPAE